jgi:hypothetical protein
MQPAIKLSNQKKADLPTTASREGLVPGQDQLFLSRPMQPQQQTQVRHDCRTQGWTAPDKPLQPATWRESRPAIPESPAPHIDFPFFVLRPFAVANCVCLRRTSNTEDIASVVLAIYISVD